jgi:myo-inositol-1-phosphate synthase
MPKVRVAIIGAGNCASSFVQGVHYYRNARADEIVPGLMHVSLGGYHIRDIEFSAAFDIDARKVGKDLSEAVFTYPNNTYKFTDVPRLGVKVERGMTHDGLGHYLSQVITKADGPTADIVDILRRTKTDVVVNYLPVGSEEATKWYVEQVLRVPCALVNCIPVFIAREGYWQRRFQKAQVPVIGDDIKSQVGATIVHRVLTRLFRDRGVRLERTSQLNVGGNTDFLNMLERSRLESKKISKTNAVTSQLDYEIGPKNVHIGPSDYVEWLDDRKWAYIRMEGRTFGDVPLNVELKLEVWDSPNSAGVVIDAVRCAKLAMDNGVSGALIGPSAYFKKSPPRQFTDEEARRLTEEFIAEMVAGAKAGRAASGRRRRDAGELAATGVAAATNGAHPQRTRSTRARGAGVSTLNGKRDGKAAQNGGKRRKGGTAKRSPAATGRGRGGAR